MILKLHKVDWWLVSAVLALSVISLATISGFSSGLFFRQLLWLGISLLVFFAVVRFDISFVKQSRSVLYAYGFGIVLLLLVLFLGTTVNGAKSWIDFGGFSFQPADFVKLVLVIVLAKYLDRRHVQIKAPKHIFITGLYFLLPFALIFLQPDFGSAMILFAIWFGMILVAGISRKHLLLLFVLGFAAFMVMWTFVFKEYQKDRLRTFMDPLSDIQGAGYNAFQSVIAVGSGQLLGKGVGYGTQSRLNFLPEHETDFIFAAVSEEWGFVGSIIVLLLFIIIISRILIIAAGMQGNFELLFAVGLAIYFLAHIVINIGMNIGVMPVTGVPLPFMSYGGSHILIEFLSLGILISLRNRQSSALLTKESPEIFLR